MPERTEQFWQAINAPIDPAAANLEELTTWGGTQTGSTVEKVALFPRVDRD